MHIQIINFHLKGVSDADYRALCDGLADSFSRVPGLTSKIWLADPETNTYGGVYVWRDRGAMESFQKSDLFQQVANHPNLDGITARDFSVLEGPTRMTRGDVTQVA